MGILSIILLVLSMSVHEIGHYVAMRKSKLNIKEICLFGTGLKLLGFKLNSTEITIRAFPIGASVEPTKTSMLRLLLLPINEKSYILINGIRYNLYVASICMLLKFCINGNYATFMTAVLLFLIAFTARWLYMIMPIIGFVFLFYMAYDLKETVAQLSVVKVYAFTYSNSSNALSVFNSIANINVSLAIFNVIPLYPMDGGKIVSGYFESLYPSISKQIRGWYMLTTIPVLAMFLIAIFNDVYSIL